MLLHLKIFKRAKLPFNKSYIGIPFLDEVIVQNNESAKIEYISHMMVNIAW